jgi:hypothetical protein
MSATTRAPAAATPSSPAYSRHRRPGARHASLLLGAVVTAALLSACGGSKANPAPTVTVTQGAPASASSSASAAAITPPAIVAVTKGGALVTLNPATGSVSSTLVASHVLGDEISVSSTGMVYFAVKHGCNSEIEAIPAAGGNAASLAQGSLPAVSPNGTKLAYANQPSLTIGCIPSNPDMVPLYHLAIRTLSSGATVNLPMVPTGQDSGLPAPISHLSWASDNDHLAVSIYAVEDNEGWNLNIVDTSQAPYYLSGTGVTSVPVTGSPTAQRSYLREGVYMPNGDLFVSRACCAGVPVRNTSRLMWEVNTSGALVHQVAVGYPNLEHVSLDVSSDGRWLLYLAGTTLYVSQGGATPRELTSGLIAAAWG